MRPPTRIRCDVLFPDDAARVGEFANAFRILPDSGEECLLDFCQYTADGNVARVVARVRVDLPFLVAIRQRVDEAIREMGEGAGSTLLLVGAPLTDPQ